jgi:hypothetical protein
MDFFYPRMSPLPVGMGAGEFVSATRGCFFAPISHLTRCPRAPEVRDAAGTAEQTADACPPRTS